MRKLCRILIVVLPTLAALGCSNKLPAEDVQTSSKKVGNFVYGSPGGKQAPEPKKPAAPAP